MTLVEFLASVKIACCDVYIVASYDVAASEPFEEGKYIHVGDDLYNNCETEEEVREYLDLPEEFEPWLDREVLEIQCDYSKAQIREWVDNGYQNSAPYPALIIYIEEGPFDEMLWNDSNLEERMFYGHEWPFVPEYDYEIKEEDWPYKLPYDVFQKADEIITYNPYLGMCIIDNIVLNGFDWAKEITDEVIEKVRERERQEDEKNKRENEERKKRGENSMVVRTNSGLSVAIFKGARELANILETHENWMSYFLMSNQFRRFLIRPKDIN